MEPPSTERQEPETPRLPGVRLAVDWEALAVAVENQRADVCHLLDLVTGEVSSREAGASPVGCEESPARRVIPPRSPREGWRTMSLFVEQVADPVARERLEACLAGKGAFRRFKDVLLAYPELRAQWFAFKDAEVLLYVARWLEREGVEPLNEPPDRPDRSRLSAAVRRQAPAGSPPRSVGSAGLVGEDGSEPGPLDWRAAVRPFERVGLVLRPRRAALVIIDMQRAFVEPSGQAFLPGAPAACARLQELLKAWRLARLPVFFTRHAHLHPHQDGGALQRFWGSLILEGTRGAELVDELRPAPGERVLVKHTYSAFRGTPLEQALRGLGVEDVVLGGVMTDLCCETTAREAFVRDFQVFFLADGTATAAPELQLGSLRSIAHGFGRVLSVDELLAQIHQPGAGGAR
jgi:nicotinamidase-related amidase